jgi:hypothetical protein
MKIKGAKKKQERKEGWKDSNEKKQKKKNGVKRVLRKDGEKM